jgi:hypothetical protein
MEVVVRSVKVKGWGVLVSYVKQMKFCATSLHVACLFRCHFSNVALRGTVSTSGSYVDAVATKMSVAKVPVYLHL